MSIHNRLLLLSAFLASTSMLLTGCSKPSSSVDGDMSESSSSASSVSVATLPINTQWNDGDGVKTISFKNMGAAPVKINQIVVNGLPDDPDCNVKIFKTYGVGETGTVTVPNCGRFTKFLVMGEGASLLTEVSQIQTDINLKDFTSVDNTVRVYNNSANEYSLKTVVYNDLPSDSKCNIKVFRTIEKHGFVDVPQTCGTFKSAELNFDSGSIEVGLFN